MGSGEAGFEGREVGLICGGWGGGFDVDGQMCGDGNGRAIEQLIDWSSDKSNAIELVATNTGYAQR